MKNDMHFIFILPDRLYLPSNAEIHELVQELAKSNLWSHQTTEIMIPKDENKIEFLNQKIAFFDKWWIEDYFYFKYKSIELLQYLPSYLYNALSGQEHMKLDEMRDDLYEKYDLGPDNVECYLKRPISFDAILELSQSPYLSLNTELNTSKYFQDLKERTSHLGNGPSGGYSPRLKLMRGLTYIEAADTPDESDLEKEWGYPKFEEWAKIREEYKRLFPYSYISRLPAMAYVGQFYLSYYDCGRSYYGYNSLTELVDIFKSSLMYQEISKAFQKVFKVQPMFLYHVS